MAVNQRSVGYFVNQYPKVSHSFIRREILALERQGYAVHRFGLRGWDAQLVDAEDQHEQQRTRYILDGGLLGLLPTVFQLLLQSPHRFLKALQLAIRLGMRADRPWFYHLIYLAEACRMLPWVQAAGLHHMHAHFGTNSAEVVMLLHALGGPTYSFTVHGPEEFDKPTFLKLREKVRHASFVVAISSYGRSQLYRWIDYPDWSKVQVVHCGLEPAFHQVPVSAIPDAPRLVCVGRLCEQKGQLLLVNALARLHAQGIDFEMVLAGDGEMRPEIEALIHTHGLQKKIRITGWISSDQVREEILASRALVLPSFAEGLPVVIMEAMALRRPVLSTYVAGIPELVLPGENGWLSPAGDIDGLAEQLLNLLQTPASVLAAMGEAAYHRVTVRHDIDIEAGKLATLFDCAALERLAAEAQS